MFWSYLYVIDYYWPALFDSISLVISIQLVRKLEHLIQSHFIQSRNHYFLILQGLKSDHLDLLKASILTFFRGKYLIGHLYKDNEYVDETWRNLMHLVFSLINGNMYQIIALNGMVERQRRIWRIKFLMRTHQLYEHHKEWTLHCGFLGPCRLQFQVS